MGRTPALLTIEEACALLRVGRTKGYAMAKQWRESGGASGLPVIDFGDVRVPLVGLERMTGAKFDDEAEVAPSDAGRGRGDIGGPGEAGMEERPADRTPEPERHASPAVPPSPTRSTRSRRASARPSNQLGLFEPPTATPTA